MTSKTSEIRLLFIGDERKRLLLNKLKDSAVSYEQHVAYKDTVYLAYDINQQTVIVELFDPGWEQTGAREMGIRRAQGLILAFSVYEKDPTSWIKEIAEEFQRRNDRAKIPVVLIEIEDDLTSNGEIFDTQSNETCEDNVSSTDHPELSEETSKIFLNTPRRLSDNESAELMKLFDANCTFLSVIASEFDGANILMKEMIESITRRKRSVAFKDFMMASTKRIRNLNSKTCSIS